MRRREFIGLATGAAASAWTPAARAQQAASVRRIGVLSPFTAEETSRWNKALLLGLRDAGWIDGRNLGIEYRYADGGKERLPELVAGLVRQKVDVIVTTVTVDTLAAKTATTEIPIVMVAVGDPVAVGIVQTLARPGGNITGLSQMTPDLSGKRLELLKQIAPQVTSVAVLFDSEDPLSMLESGEARRSAQTMGIDVHSLGVGSAGDFGKVLNEVVAAGVGALVVMPGPVLFGNLKLIADFATEKRLPSAFHLREFPALGGLLSYGVDRGDLFRRAAAYVDKILKGARPSDLPIEQPTKFELVINARTAKALGLAVSPNLLGIADEVIE
jgi:putative ABC transport system substrate-binding protein